MRLIVENHQISIAHVETRQVLTSILGIENVLIDNKCSSPSVGGTAPVYVCMDEGLRIVGKSCLSSSHVSLMWLDLQSDLANGSVLAKYVVHLLRGDLKGEVPEQIKQN